MDFEFQIESKKHGLVTVVAPERFRREIEALTWHVRCHRFRGEGRRFSVCANIPHPGGGKRTVRAGGGKRYTSLYLHQFVWLLSGNPPANEIDHRDGQPLNNSETNLRAATHAQNMRNRPLQRNNTSGWVGVYQRGRKWAAWIKANGKQKSLGSFASSMEARMAREAAMAEHHGEFAFGHH